MQQQEEALAELKSATLRRLFHAIEQHGPLGAPDLRRDLPINGDGDVWKARPDGMTKELRALQTAGLIQQVGTREGRGPATKIYAVTPEGEIKKAAQKFKRELPKLLKLRGRDMSGTAAQIADYRRQEKEAGLSARALFIEKRRRVLELGRIFRDLEPMVYWSEAAVPHDELEQVYDELVKVVAAGTRLEAAVDSMRGDKQLREKIKALRAKADSSEFPGEAGAFRAKARELESGLR
jgi:DNA-binding PadR family transcriptional regulator